MFHRQNLRQCKLCIANLFSYRNKIIALQTNATNTTWKRINREIASFVYRFLDRLLAFAEELAAARRYRILVAVSVIIVATHLRFPACTV